MCNTLWAAAGFKVRQTHRHLSIPSLTLVLRLEICYLQVFSAHVCPDHPDHPESFCSLSDAETAICLISDHLIV